ncbi:protein of unknown function DUF1192 [Methylobacterium sp. 4-46]|uniref:DUF1192 domain-containing protein n=1 Tax=unclassified Methylobacterium TaxID=2615210 RepID=UPI000152CE80|nr:MULTISPECIES: DUF1192 domain-containing protein [Methylobacterium]ACA19404.1 protein of unknown function DUF1192 [Methylobacterium sp. 4-46]WFT78602.1 DUF1192 domain-containing protein [Methylobacterium nodulans]
MLTDDDRPRPQTSTHVLGQDLTALSLGDLDARIALLRAEIARLEEARRHRQASQEAAKSVFKF